SSKTARAYVRRWTRYLDDSPDAWGAGRIRIKKKRHEDEVQIRDQIMADLNRAIELDPEVGEYYYLRYCMRYGSQPGEPDLDRATKLDPSIAEVLRDRKRARAEGPGFLQHIQPIIRPFNPGEFLANTPRPMVYKEPWRLKCLQD